MIQQNPKDDAELVWVPGGTLIMGSDPGPNGGTNSGSTVSGRCELVQHTRDGGQVREWCADWYDPEYYRQSPRLNPPGPDRSWPGYIPHRVLRGGAWCGPAYTSRGAQRLCYPPASRDTNDHGLRPLMTKVLRRGE